MTAIELISILKYNRKLRTQNEINEFSRALSQLMELPLDIQILEELLLVYDDECKQIHFLLTLNKYIDRFDARTRVRTIIKMSNRMAENAAYWLYILFSDLVANETTFNIIINEISNMSGNEREQISILANKILAEPIEDKELAEYMRSAALKLLQKVTK